MNPPDRPDVSILVPFHNRADLTLPCLESIVEHTRNVSYEILLVDDASTEALDLSRLEGRAPLRLMPKRVRGSYSACNNLAAAEARGEYLCLLNNDTLVTPNWLHPMVKLLRAAPDIGVLGNKHLFPGTGLLHHAGIAFQADGFPIHLHPHTDPSAPAVNYERDMPCVTFACVMIPSGVYRQMGGLDEAYRNGFEDCDFCLRARAAGFRVAYTPASVIYHYGQSSPGRTHQEDANWNLFRARWGDRVEKTFESLTRADVLFNRRMKKMPRRRKALPPGLHLDLHPNEPSAFTWAGVDLALELVKAGVAVSVPPAARVHGSIGRRKAWALRGLMRARPRGTYQVRWSHYWPQYLKKPLSGDVNAEFFCTNYRYRAEGRWLDVWMRHVQANEYRKMPVSDFNRQALLEIGVPPEDCITVPLGYSPEVRAMPAEMFQPRVARDDIHLLLVTNSHDLQRYGTDLAVKALGEALGPGDPVVLHIKDYGVGGGGLLEEWIAAQPRFPRVVWHREFLGKEDLLRLYAGMDVQLAPFRGEGFAMKLLDGMAVGLPAMFPEFGGPADFAAAGTFLPLAFREVDVGPCFDRSTHFVGEGAYWCEVEFGDLVDKLRALPAQRETLARIGAAARAHVLDRFSWEASARKMMEALRTWEGERNLVVSARRSPGELPLSVVIPTKDRIEVFGRTIEAYRQQSLPPDQYELLVVNDHGRRPPLEDLLARHEKALPIRMLDNDGVGGPAAARNLAIRRARGDVVLITGDDIVPDRDFLRQHLMYHERFPHLETAIVGLTLWHPELPMTPFQRHITGKGGQQFAYSDMKDGRSTAYDRLYTSNCSLKRLFLAEEEVLFSTKYRYAAYEDVELGYRLHLRGMNLRFAEKAKGYHLHAMTPASFVERQRKVGRMLTLLAVQRPGYVPDHHLAFLRALEFLRSWPAAPRALTDLPFDSEDLASSLLACYDTMLTLGSSLDEAADRPVVDQDRMMWQRWMEESGHHTWESVNEMILRMGMAEEWCEDPRMAEQARAWVLLLTLPRIVGFNHMQWKMPFAVPDEVAPIFPGSGTAYHIAKFIRKMPVVGDAVRTMEQSAPGRAARAAVVKLLRNRGKA